MGKGHPKKFIYSQTMSVKLASHPQLELASIDNYDPRVQLIVVGDEVIICNLNELERKSTSRIFTSCLLQIFSPDTRLVI